MANAIMPQSNPYANAISNALATLKSPVASMTSKEIADMVGSQHGNVKISIERLAKRGVIQLPALQKVEDKQSLSPNNKTEVYVFSGEQGKRDSYVVVAQLSPEFTAKLVDRWRELERQVSGTAQPQPTLPSPVQQAVDLTPGMLKVAELFGFEGNQAKLSANRAIRTFTGVDLLEAMGQKALIAPENEPLLTPTDIAVRLGIGKMSANPLLIAAGLQTGHRDGKNRLYYELTDLGRPHGVYLDVEKENGHGTPVRQLKWKASVLPALEAYMQIVS